MGIPLVVLTGGEPLLRPDLFELVEHCQTIKLKTGLATNGSLLTKEKAGQLKDAGLKLFHFSLDGASEDIHSAYRGKGNFQQVLSGMDTVLSMGASVIVQSILTRANEKDFGNIAGLLFPKKIKAWRIQFSLPCGRGQETAFKEEFSAQEKMEAMERVYSLSKEYAKAHIDMHAFQYYKVFLYKKYRNDIKKKILLRLRGGCSLMRGAIIYVDSDGFVRPCPYFPYRIEDKNVKTEGLINIFRRDPLLNRLRDKKNIVGACRNCRYSFCCGGCRAKVFYRTGDFFGEDKDCPYLRLKEGA
jgi:radical SAM protein with 4Fe4S-binding SPASM domain